MFHLKRKTYFVVLVIILGTGDISQQSKHKSIFLRDNIKSYCDLKCGDYEHTLCNPKEANKDKCGEDFKEFPISELFIEIMLDGHNGIRNRIATAMKASDMKIMIWDNELASMAKYWIRKCNLYEKDPCANLYKEAHIDQDETGAYNFVNQNFATHKSLYYPVNFPESCIRTWYMEKLHMKKPNIEVIDKDHKQGFFNRTTNNFTQLAYSMATHVGCAMARIHGIYFLACNYFPYAKTGYAFLNGRPASQCPNLYPLRDLKYTSLCTAIGGRIVNSFIICFLCVCFVFMVRKIHFK